MLVIPIPGTAQGSVLSIVLEQGVAHAAGMANCSCQQGCHTPGTTRAGQKASCSFSVKKLSGFLLSTMRPTGCRGNSCSGQILVTSSGSKSYLSSSSTGMVYGTQTLLSTREICLSNQPTWEDRMSKSSGTDACSCILSRHHHH